MDTWAFIGLTLMIGAVIGSFAVGISWLTADRRRSDDEERNPNER